MLRRGTTRDATALFMRLLRRRVFLLPCFGDVRIDSPEECEYKDDDEDFEGSIALYGTESRLKFDRDGVIGADFNGGAAL